MIREIQSYIHSATGTAYATCRSSKYGICTQWGASEMDALSKLKIFVEIHWGETWPEVIQKTPGSLKKTLSAK